MGRNPEIMVFKLLLKSLLCVHKELWCFFTGLFGVRLCISVLCLNFGVGFHIHFIARDRGILQSYQWLKLNYAFLHYMCCDVLGSTISSIFNFSSHEGSFSSASAHARVLPVLKKPSFHPANMSVCRPIST